MSKRRLLPSLGRLASGLAAMFQFANLIQNTKICHQIDCVDIKSPVGLVTTVVN